MRARLDWACLGVVSLASVQCSYPSTFVEVVLGTDASPTRRLTLVVTTISQPNTTRISPREVATYGGQSAGLADPFSGSFSVLPARNDRGGRVEVLIEATLDRTDVAPSQTLRRRLRFGFLANAHQQVRVFMPTACLNPSADCTREPSESCTVQSACEERGETCGNEGRCVAVDVVPESVPEAGVTLFDARASEIATRRDAAMDAAMDVTVPGDVAVMDAGMDVTVPGDVAGMDAVSDVRDASDVRDVASESAADGSDGAVTWSGAARISGGGGAVCAMDVSGNARCWGNGALGRLGLASSGATPTPIAPVRVGLMDRYDTGFHHGCSIRGTQLLCYGGNSQGEVRLPAMMQEPTPYVVPGAWSRVSTGANFTCALNTMGALWCWGGEGSGRLARGSVVMGTYAPTMVTSVSATGALTDVQVGSSHGIALGADGRVWTWGSNASGELGLGGGGAVSRLTQVTGLPRAATAIAAGWQHSCALLNDRSLYCWGFSSRVGNGSATNALSPALVSGFTNNVARVTADYENTCAATVAGELWCWGSNNFGQIGSGSVSPTVAVPTRVAGLALPLGDVVVGYGFACAIANSRAFCWGNNQSAQLGRGSLMPASAPLPGPVVGL
ncbi:MAG: hypothetical protein Q8Q09_15605 [Deltaproteobacteria bacterium]|nr:hypothetical protein [Deltaproteobacteria bacterium]